MGYGELPEHSPQACGPMLTHSRRREQTFKAAPQKRGTRLSSNRPVQRPVLSSWRLPPERYSEAALVKQNYDLCSKIRTEPV